MFLVVLACENLHVCMCASDAVNMQGLAWKCLSIYMNFHSFMYHNNFNSAGNANQAGHNSNPEENKQKTTLRQSRYTNIETRTHLSFFSPGSVCRI